MLSTKEPSAIQPQFPLCGLHDLCAMLFFIRASAVLSGIARHQNGQYKACIQTLLGLAITYD
jgi:hypothetical protein